MKNVDAPKQRLHVFSSFAEANAFDDRLAVQQTPIERIRETVQLILRVYGVTEEQLKECRRKLRLTMISYE